MHGRNHPSTHIGMLGKLGVPIQFENFDIRISGSDSLYHFLDTVWQQFMDVHVRMTQSIAGILFSSVEIY